MIVFLLALNVITNKGYTQNAGLEVMRMFGLWSLMKRDSQLSKHQTTDAVFFSKLSNLKSSKHGT
jgi:hypothetical protein